MANFKLRSRLIAAFGGKCQRCGYSKSLRALHYHHADASEKYEWSNGRASLKEVEMHPERFILVCANCHAEIHDEIDESRRAYATCLHCEKRFQSQTHRSEYGRGKYCSKQCQHAARDKYARSEQSIIDRFWKNIKKLDTGCWEWQSHLHFGKFPYLLHKQENGKWTTRSVRRISYELHVAPLVKSVVITPSCGNDSCVNPDHLKIRK
jgi:hypothetical protein